MKRDIENFKSLGINTIRIYTVDNSKNHDEGMKLLDDAGIYLTLDANTPEYSLNRETVQTCHRSYNEVYLQNVFATIDAFKDYNNLFMFFSGNEVINAKNNTGTAPYIKAVTRDMKSYIARRNYRKIPVGYSAADVAENIVQQALYFNCGTDDERSDFFAFNDYSWCDPSSFQQSGWDQKVRTYSNYSIPLFLSEFGCITNTRVWGEIASLYHTNMTGVYSGGLAYEYTVEPNGFGLVEVKDGKITPNDDFQRLKEAYAKTKNPTGNGGFKATGSPSRCPPEDPEWEVKSSNLPAIPEGAVTFMSNGAGKPVGLEGQGSHFAGTPSKSSATPGSGSGGGNGGNNSQGQGQGGNGTGAAMSVAIPFQFMAMVAASVVFGVAMVF